MTKSIELMTPTQYLSEAQVWIRSTTVPGRVLTESFTSPARGTIQCAPTNTRLHEQSIRLSLHKGLPVCAEAVNQYRTQLPEGYVLRGGRYALPISSHPLNESVLSPAARAIWETASPATKPTIVDAWNIAQRLAPPMLRKYYVKDSQLSSDDLVGMFITKFIEKGYLATFDPEKGSLEGLVYTSMLRILLNYKRGSDPLNHAQSADVHIGGDVSNGNTVLDMVASTDERPDQNTSMDTKKILSEVPTTPFKGKTAVINGAEYAPTLRNLVDLFLQGYSKRDLAGSFGVSEAASGQILKRAIAALPMNLLSELKGGREGSSSKRVSRVTEAVCRIWRQYEERRILEANTKGKTMSKINEAVGVGSDVEYVVWGVPPGASEEALLLTVFEGKPITSISMAQKLSDLLVAKYGVTQPRVRSIDLKGELGWGNTPTGSLDQTNAGGTVKQTVLPDEGYADGGEPYTDEELALMDKQAGGVRESVSDFIRACTVQRFVESRLAEKSGKPITEAYGNKRDHKKIDIYVGGKYVASTTWAKSCKEAKDKYLEKNPKVDASTVKTSFSAKNESVNESADPITGDDHVCCGTCPDCKCAPVSFKLVQLNLEDGSIWYKLFHDLYDMDPVPAKTFIPKMEKLVPQFDAHTGDSREYLLKVSDVKKAFGSDGEPSVE